MLIYLQVKKQFLETGWKDWQFLLIKRFLVAKSLEFLELI